MENIKINSERYVYFNETGEILKILNYKDPDESHIMVDYSDVADIISGKKSFFNFVVVYDSESSAYVLNEKITNNNFAFNASEYIYEIPKVTNDTPVDVTIIQDLVEKKWKFKLRPVLQNQLKIQQMSVNTPMIISITQAGNPHILYRTLRVSFDEILYADADFFINFQYDTEENQNLSIYTIKKLKSYKHEVVND
jgi:hypothetical protein